jgi:hypothetical protein
MQPNVGAFSHREVNLQQKNYPTVPNCSSKKASQLNLDQLHTSYLKIKTYSHTCQEMAMVSQMIMIISQEATKSSENDMSSRNQVAWKLCREVRPLLTPSFRPCQQ